MTRGSVTVFFMLAFLPSLAQADPIARAAALRHWRPLSTAHRDLGEGVGETTVTLQVGPGPYDKLGLHRVVREVAPGVPAPTARALVLLHGDFASFDSNYVPSKGAFAAAPFLAARGIDVWGIDRRWTFVPATATDLSSLANQGFDAAIADTAEMIEVVRAVRTLDGDPRAPALAGWSRGAQLAYAYAINDASKRRPSIDGVAPLDTYYALAPADADLRQQACVRAAQEQQQLAAGSFGSDNSFQIQLGLLDESAPDAPSPLLPPATNHQALLTVAAQTYLFAPFTNWYHFAAATLDGTGSPTALTYSRGRDLDRWLEASPPQQALAEISDGDAIWCGQRSPIAGTLADIRQPLFYIGAAGGFGPTGLYSARQVSSSDVQTRVVQLAVMPSVDFGHTDMVLSAIAAREVWQPLARWLTR